MPGLAPPGAATRPTTLPRMVRRPVTIGPEQAALMRRPVSVLVGSRDAAHRPHLMRAVGFRVAADGSVLRVLLPAGRASAVLADIRANGEVAVVFSEPSTHRTLQVKGRDARVEPPGPDAAAIAADYLRGFSEEITSIGFPAIVAQRIAGTADEALVEVVFTPTEAFDQTPGPQAGCALGADAAA